MPKNLFFLLADEKQNRIKQAAFDEFSEHLYHEASINQIIKMAGIPRGSFYQYFEDKEDLYFFLIESVMKVRLIPYLESHLTKESADVFTINRQILLYILSLLSEEKNKSFAKNLFLSMTYKLEKRFASIIERGKEAVLAQRFPQVMDESGYKNPYLKELLKIIGLINRDLYAQKAIENLDDDCILEIYDTRMKLLRSARDFNK